MKRPFTFSTLARQKGISLLSLMIASAIGIFLTGAALKIYVDSKSTFSTRNVLAEVVENQRFALDDMRRILVMAGRDIRAVEDADPNNSFPQLHTFPPVTNDASAAIADESEFIYDGNVNDPDVIAIRYRAGPSCGSYQNVPIKGKLQKRLNGTIYRDDKTCRPTTVRFKVVNNDLICEVKSYYTRDNTTGQTTCINNTSDASLFAPVLASGVHMLKVLYGVDDDNDGYASRYLTASEVANWRDVVSIRIALVGGSVSKLPASARKSSEDSLDVLGWSYDEPDTEHLYRTTTATISLRNFNTTVQRQ